MLEPATFHMGCPLSRCTTALLKVVWSMYLSEHAPGTIRRIPADDMLLTAGLGSEWGDDRIAELHLAAIEATTVIMKDLGANWPHAECKSMGLGPERVIVPLLRQILA